jgi:DNA-binding MarR family transcriptional regulator
MKNTVNRIMSINATMSKFYRIRNRILLKRYNELNLTVLQVTVLRAVYENNGCIQKELCALVDVAPTVMVGVISGLENAGLVERQYCAENRRITNVYITEKGVAYVMRVKEIIEATENEHMIMLSPEEKDQFHKLLIKALNSWTTVDEAKL